MRKKYTKGPITIDEIMANTITLDNGCIEWKGSIARNGYGQIRRNKKIITVTRLIMHLKNGFDLNSPLWVLHHCDNPRCINIDHLYVGNCRDNINDKIKRDRHNRGRRVWKAKLKDSDIQKIFDLSNSGWTGSKIAKLYKIENSSIYLILRRKAWKHVKIKNNNCAKCAKTKENLCS